MDDPGEPPARERSAPLDPRQISLGIYGIIVSASVMAASAGQNAVYGVAIAVFVTMLVYWLAERYAEIVALRSIGHRPSKRRTLLQGWALVQASYAPLAVLIVAGLLGASVELAVTISMISSTGLLVGFGWVAGRRGGLTGVRLILAALFSGFLGLVLIGLKLSLH